MHPHTPATPLKCLINYFSYESKRTVTPKDVKRVIIEVCKPFFVMAKHGRNKAAHYYNNSNSYN